MVGSAAFLTLFNLLAHICIIFYIKSCFLGVARGLREGLLARGLRGLREACAIEFACARLARPNLLARGLLARGFACARVCLREGCAGCARLARVCLREACAIATFR